jgi:hypothetical protein
MALATAIDFLVLQSELLASKQGSQMSPPIEDPTETEVRCSGRMLFEMAKAFDEYPDDNNKGSSLRGAIKGFYQNGVYRRPHDETIEGAEWEDKDWIFDIKKAQISRGTVLGHYARLGPSILDYQSAIMHIGIIYASASVDTGWNADAVRQHDGVIRSGPDQDPLGNHAFVIIGYTNSGFLVLNSAGTDWGGWSNPHEPEEECWSGVALWPYENWSHTILDAWVLQLGVPIDAAQFRQLDPGKLDAKRWGGFAGQGITRLFVNGHYLHYSDGQMASSGVFVNDATSVEQTSSLLESRIPEKSKLGFRRRYSDLVLVIESGLDSLETMVRRCASYAARLLADPSLTDDEFKPYPISVIWRKDVLQLTEDLLAARAQRIEARTGGYADAKAHMLDAYAREFLQPIWRSFEGEAERCFFAKPGEKRGQSWTSMQQLLNAATSGDRPMRIHFVVHGAAMPWFESLVRRLAEPGSAAESSIHGLSSIEIRRRLVASVTLLAPICTPEHLRELLALLWGEWNLPEGQAPRPLAIYTQPAQRDREENLAGYQGSFLELARRCFPVDGNRPTFTHPNLIAGHADGLQVVREQLSGRNLLEVISIPDSAETSHAALLSNPELVRIVFRRIKACAMQGRLTSP